MICNTCKKDKPETAFGRCGRHSSGLKQDCKSCRTEARRAYRQENPQRVKDQNYKDRYGISLDEVNHMRELQNHECAICRKHETQTSRGLFVDHCHDTGAVRGLLCHECNVVLGMSGDSIYTLRNAITYLGGTP